MDQNHEYEQERRLITIEQDLKAMNEKMNTLQNDVSSLVAAWKAANWLVSTVKWLGGLAIAVTAIVAVFKGKV